MVRRSAVVLALAGLILSLSATASEADRRRPARAPRPTQSEKDRCMQAYIDCINVCYQRPRAEQNDCAQECTATYDRCARTFD